jgi:hypothetical protein
MFKGEALGLQAMYGALCRTLALFTMTIRLDIRCSARTSHARLSYNDSRCHSAEVVRSNTAATGCYKTGFRNTMQIDPPNPQARCQLLLLSSFQDNSHGCCCSAAPYHIKAVSPEVWLCYDCCGHAAADTHTFRIPRVFYHGPLSSVPGGGQPACLHRNRSIT